MTISIIAAKSLNNVIGIDNKLPWHCPADMRFFKQLTTGNIVIMGRKTFESIGRALPDRANLVIASRFDKKRICSPNLVILPSLDAALDLAERSATRDTFIIGGGEVYKAAINDRRMTRLYITEIQKEHEGDTFFPDIDNNIWREAARSVVQGEPDLHFITYLRK